MRNLLFSWLFLIPLCSIFFSIDIVTVSAQCLEGQRSLLLQLKNSLKFDSSISTKLVKWGQSVDCCTWGGVICNDAGRVVRLNLSSESISGGIDNASSLFGLQHLQSLNLAYNRFNSTEIPPGFDKLTSLTYLNLSNANFAGQIPIEISRMKRLVILDLSSLYFPGSHSLKLENPNLLMLVGNLTELTELCLDGVNISAQGNEWYQALSSSLPYLRVLSLSNCYLPGPIDSSLVKLRYLSVIRLDKNNFSSPVPEFFANFTNLTSLRLSSSGLYGKIPEKIFQVPSLQTLDLSNNGLLQGSLPEFPQNGSLETLVLRDTNFSGKLPDSMGNLKRLSRIELANCNFSGSIPNSMASLTQLVYLDFSSNNFSGSIPSFGLSKNLTQINLSHNNLMGQITSYQWESLQKLVILDLRYNSLNGSIPLSLFSLPLLQKIQLSDNKFAGQFNEFLIASSYLLDTLDLSSNNLEGPIPMSVFGLWGLKILSLSNNFFNGTVELSMIRNLKNLTSLDLSFNSLTISTSGSNSALSTLPQFSRLVLASCKLGVFPNLKNQSKLLYLDLSNNQIGGEIPNWIWKVGNGSLLHLNLSYNMLVDFEKPLPNPYPNLSVLDLHSNKLQGQIPILTSSASFLDYSNNKFSSSIPADIGNNIIFSIFFSFSNNNLTGTIPESICNASYLQVLDLSFNGLNGMIPKCLIQMSKILGVLNLQGNSLSGTIPDTFQSECKLKTLDFNGNQIEGLVPRTLANCTMLEVLNLGNNRINDNFPCWLKNSHNLRVLVLRSNRFHGSIACPGRNSNLSMLQIVDLASNNFSGNLSQQCFLSWKAMMVDEDALQSEANHLRFGYLELSHLYYQDAVTVTLKGLELELVKILTVFTSIDFSCNRFEGEIPEEIGKLKSLYVLNFSHNAFTGHIPTSLGNLTQLESLDLSNNKLIGTIPVQFAMLNFLSVLNLSFNQLVGMIPRSTQLQSFNETSFKGNKGLCGPPLNENCANEGPPPAYQDPTSTSPSGFDWQFILTGLGFGQGVGMVVGPLMFWKKGRKWYNEHVDAFLSMILPLVGYVYTSYDDDGRVEAEESFETELTDITGDYNDDDEDEMEDEAFRGRFCVFCSKLDIRRKKAIHNPKCTCHNSPPISSSSSTSSSSSS